jgi:hypothetical protein
MSRKIFLKGNYYSTPKRQVICTKTSCSLSSKEFEGTDIETGEHLTDLSCMSFNEMEKPLMFTKTTIEVIRNQAQLDCINYIIRNHYNRTDINHRMEQLQKALLN